MARTVANLFIIAGTFVGAWLLYAFMYVSVLPALEFPNVGDEPPVLISDLSLIVIGGSFIAGFVLAVFAAVRLDRPPYLWWLTWGVGLCALAVWTACLLIVGYSLLGWLQILREIRIETGM